MYEDLDTDVKGEYLGAGGNPISTVLELVQNLSSRVLTHPNAAILLRSPLWCLYNAAVYSVWHNVLCYILCHLLYRFKTGVLVSLRINLM